MVGDGKWIWTKPPEGETGYLEPRKYEVSIGIQLEGTGSTRQIKATTPVPVEFPEQKIEEVKTEADGCRLRLRQLTPEAGQLGRRCTADPIAHRESQCPATNTR